MGPFEVTRTTTIVAAEHTYSSAATADNTRAGSIAAVAKTYEIAVATAEKSYASGLVAADKQLRLDAVNEVYPETANEARLGSAGAAPLPFFGAVGRQLRGHRVGGETAAVFLDRALVTPGKVASLLRICS